MESHQCPDLNDLSYLTCLEIPWTASLAILVFIWSERSPSVNSLFLRAFVKTINNKCLTLQMSQITKRVAATKKKMRERKGKKERKKEKFIKNI